MFVDGVTGQVGRAVANTLIDGGAKSASSRSDCPSVTARGAIRRRGDENPNRWSRRWLASKEPS
jgi:hypothetical protein